MKSTKNVVICLPCGEQSLAPEGFNPGVAVATKEGQNREKTLWPLLPRLTAVLPPQGREMFRGFTLIELLVVVLIIGILAAVALPQYQKAVYKAQGREILNAVHTLDKGLAAYYLEHGNFSKHVGTGGLQSIYPTDLDIEIPELKYSKYVTHADEGAPVPIEASKLSKKHALCDPSMSPVYAYCSVTFVLPDGETVLQISWNKAERQQPYFRGDIGKYFPTKTVSAGTSTALVLDEPALAIGY